VNPHGVALGAAIAMLPVGLLILTRRRGNSRD
jgi:hypothetical protein